MVLYCVVFLLDVFDNVVCFIIVLRLCSYVVSVLIMWCWCVALCGDVGGHLFGLFHFCVLRLCSCSGMRRAC